MAMLISEIVKQFDLGNIKGDDTWDIETMKLFYMRLKRLYVVYSTRVKIDIRRYL